MEQLVVSKEEMDKFAQSELARLSAQKENTKNSGATILGLSGELGAGKTTFVQALARGLGISETVTSPTFVIARFYSIPHNDQFNKLVHIDAYRIEDEAELAPINWGEIVADPKNLVVVEWPQRIGSLFPEYAHVLEFTVINETTRKIFDRKNI